MANASNRIGSKRILISILVLMMVITSACNFPAPFQPTQTTQPTAGPAPTQAATTIPIPRPQPTPSEPLPPALVETSPQPLSEIGPKTAFTFYFNQPMERGSVQAALQAQPAVAGSFQWVNDATVKFTPDQALPLNTSLAVNFTTAARATNGLALSAPVALNFQTTGGFALVDQLPRPGVGDADPSSAVVATFTRPVTALGADPKTLPAAFNLDPAAKGRGEWLNTSTYIFYPDPPLLGGTQYSVVLNKGLTGADGSTWAAEVKPADWKFTTARPSLLSVAPDGKTEILLDNSLILTFNQPMDPASLQQNLAVKGPGGDSVAGKLNWNDAETQVSFQADGLLKRATKYTLTLSSKTQARGGTPLGKDFSISYTTVPDFGLRSSEPANNGTLQLYDVYGGVRVRFSAPLAKQDLSGKFSFQPPVGDPFISRFSDFEVYISGIFAYRTAYTLTIQSGIQDQWGQALKEPLVIHFQSQAPQPALTLPALMGSGVVFLAPRETAMGGSATNLKTLQVSSASLSAVDFARIASISTYERGSKYSGPRLATFEKKLSLPADKNVPVDIPLNVEGKALPTGLYFYQLNSPELNAKAGQTPAAVMVVVSRVNISLKLSQSQLTAWAVNLDTNRPLSGASLAIYSSGKNGELNQLGTIKTDDQGLAQLETGFPQDYTPIYAILGKPGDANFSLAMTTWTDGVNSYDFGLPADSRETLLHTYLYTERPIYRPGQEVDFRVLVHQEKNGRYTPADLKQVNVTASGEYSRSTGGRVIFYQNALTLSEYGSAAGSFNLPETATPGYYTIELAEDPDAALTFQVANYRKPEVDLQATFSQTDLRAGQDIQAAILAKYYFGAPAGSLNLHWSLYSQASGFGLPEGFQAGPLDNGWLLPRGFGDFFGSELGTLVAEGQLTTAQDGSANLTVPAKKWLDVIDETRTQHLTLEVTFQDEQELPVSTRVEGTIHPANLYLGVRPDAWSGQAKNEAGFTVQTFDWKKAPVANQKLSATYQKVVYRQKTDWNWQSGTPPYTLEVTKIGSTDFQVDAQGRARVAFTPPEPGTYQVELRGENALTQVLFWVGGEGRAPWPALPDNHIRMVTDAASYQPGQTAKLFIPNPLGDRTLALITVERGRVMKTDVVAFSTASLEWVLPIEEGFAPNVYVSVLLLNATNGTPVFRVGYSELSVSPAALVLQVALGASPATAAPGSDVRLGIQVKDVQGKPVQGEFSLSVVDKAVLTLADPNAPIITDSFYGRQPLGVSTSLPLVVYGRPIQTAREAMAGGRGGGGNLTAPVVRSDFRDTAFWSGKVVTDANGAAEISVHLPDNLTTWVVTARGLSRDLRVGEGAHEIIVSKDLLIRPVTPRFLVVGDRVQLGATVNNNTAKAISADVSLQATGLELETPGQASQKVDLPAQGRARVSWWAKVLDVDKADLLFSVKGGGLEDASRAASGSLPVEKYVVPQTFGTGGLLAEAGERLEVISAPRSFNPTGGELRVELSPSLAASVLSGLKALDNFPLDVTEPVLSRLLANLEVYQALQKLGIESPELRSQLETVIQQSMSRLVSWQNKDGGWGWASDQDSDAYLSTYVLFGLSEAVHAGVQVDAAVLKKAGDYVATLLIAPAANTSADRLDRLAFQYFALQQAGRGQKTAAGLYEFREKLSPWARGLLALTLNALNANDPQAHNLVSDLQAQALRSATGAHWETGSGAQLNLGTPVFTTAVVSLAMARLDPAAAVLTDAVRYLSAHRRANGSWASSYESAWVLMGLTEVMRGTGELSASFAYSGVLNGTPIVSGKAGGPGALTPVESRVPLSQLRPDSPNGLKIVHADGIGRLYYRAYLTVERPVEQVASLDRGLTISRQIFLAGQDCTKNVCQPVTSVRLIDQRELFVRLTLTLPQAMYHLAVEDFIPAGAEIVDNSLKTVPLAQTGQGYPGEAAPLFRSADPFGSGWNWWLFGAPKLYDDHIRWTAPYLAAGTYVLTYRLTPLQAGEFRLLPAHAYETYFPEVEGSSAGAIFRIDP